jgi:hypothetical protein
MTQIKMKKVIVGEQTEKDFLALPKKIYSEMEQMQSISEEKAQLSGTHPLSYTYRTQGYVGYFKEQPVIRGILFKPNQDNVGYIGYFESFNNFSMMEAFINYLCEEAQNWGVSKLIGPVQGSFWVGYRMKIKGFDDIFTNEPHNPEYYPNLWQHVGFEMTEKYRSNFYQEISPEYESEKMSRRYNLFLKKGYQIISPKRKDWEKVSVEVFELLRQLYKDFPLYQEISATEFQTLFADLKIGLDFSMVKLAYKDDELVGFLITLPDYGNLIYRKMTPVNLFKLLRLRKKAAKYIILYLGADPKHLGLGLAMNYPLLKEVQNRQAGLVGGLIHEGTVTGSYITGMQDYTHEYCLWELEMNK